MKHNKTLNIDNLPSPKGKFIIGNVSELTSNKSHQALENWVKEAGNVFKINLFGKKMIVSADPDINMQILKQRPEKFERLKRLNDIMSEIGITGVSNTEGEIWKKQRKLVAEALNYKNVNAFLPIIQKVTERFYKRLENLSTSNEKVNILEEAVKYSVDIITAIAFGYDMNTIENNDDPIQQHLEKILPMILERALSPLPLWKIIKSKKDKELDHSFAEVKRFINQFTEAAKKQLSTNPSLKENPSNFLEALLIEQEKNSDFTDEEVFGNIFTMLIGGGDTTASSIAWTLFHLSQNPGIFLKVREEANNVFGNSKYIESNEQLNKLVYTDAVINEAIRLRPVVPALYMQAIEDITVHNLELKKGMTIILQTKVNQTEEKYFSNANDFIPERWIEKGCPMHNNHNPKMIKAFGGGARFCPGKQLAIHELKTIISMICKNYDLDLDVNPEDVEEVFSITMAPENLIMKITKTKDVLTSV